MLASGIVAHHMQLGTLTGMPIQDRDWNGKVDLVIVSTEHSIANLNTVWFCQYACRRKHQKDAICSPIHRLRLSPVDYRVKDYVRFPSMTFPE